MESLKGTFGLQRHDMESLKGTIRFLEGHCRGSVQSCRARSFLKTNLGRPSGPTPTSRKPQLRMERMPGGAGLSTSLNWRCSYHESKSDRSDVISSRATFQSQYFSRSKKNCEPLACKLLKVSLRRKASRSTGGFLAV